MIVSIHGSADPSGRNAVIDGLETKQVTVNVVANFFLVVLTVYNKIRTLPRATAKNTQPVQTLVSNPLKKLATKTAEMTMTVENSY